MEWISERINSLKKICMVSTPIHPKKTWVERALNMNTGEKENYRFFDPNSAALGFVSSELSPDMDKKLEAKEVFWDEITK